MTAGNDRDGRGQGPAGDGGGLAVTAWMAGACVLLCCVAAATLTGGAGGTGGRPEQPLDGARRLHVERCERLRESGSPFDGTSAGLGEAIDCRDVFGRDVFAEACRAFTEKGTPYSWPDERQLCPRTGDGTVASAPR